MTIVFHDGLIKHEQWKEHPESPLRIRTIRKKLEKEGLWKNIVEPKMITDEDVLKVHTEKHLARLKNGGDMLIDVDTVLKDDTYEIAMRSASVAATAVEIALGGEPTFAITRPPGHHAGKDFMGGFCYLNNAAIAVEKAGVKTAIVDLDVHHCDGTESIFGGRSDVLLIDLHETDLYTGTGHLEDVGEGAGLGYTVNIPMPTGSGNSTYEKVMNDVVIPIIIDYDPELLVVCLGVDGHYCDENSNVKLNTQQYIRMCKKLLDVKKDRKIAFILEGGYHLRATAEVIAGVVAAFEGKEIKAEYGETMNENMDDGQLATKNIKCYHSKYWKL